MSIDFGTRCGILALPVALGAQVGEKRYGGNMGLDETCHPYYAVMTCPEAILAG